MWLGSPAHSSPTLHGPRLSRAEGADFLHVSAMYGVRCAMPVFAEVRSAFFVPKGSVGIKEFLDAAAEEPCSVRAAVVPLMSPA